MNAPGFPTPRPLLHVLAALSVLAFAAPAADDIPAHQARQIFEAAPAQARVAPKQLRRVLIWNTPAHLMEKDPHKGYCIPYGSAALEALGRKTGAFEPVVSDDLAMYLPGNLDRFDAIVMNNSSGPWITPTDADLAQDAFRKHGVDRAAVEQALRQSLRDYVTNGGGIVSLHYAIAANPHWPEFGEMLGGKFTGHPWNEEIGVSVEEPTHPLVAAFGGKEFRIADEIYEYGPPYDRSKLRVLLSLDPARSNMGVKWITRKDNDFALAWVKSYGRGRVFNTSFGHRTELFWDPRVLAFYLDAIQFAIGDLEAPTAPRSDRARRHVPGGEIDAALRALERMRADGLITERQFQRKRAMLEDRRSGRFKSTALSQTDPAEVNLLQNGGFEEVNQNSARNRSRWLWWGGWSWGGDYENFWESRKEYVHSGSYSAGIRCTGQPGRIGISTPKLPLVLGVKEYEFAVWAKGEGGNELFLNFESGASGTLRRKIGPEWEQISLKGQADPDAKEFTLYLYATGQGTIWLDDARLVPRGEPNDD